MILIIREFISEWLKEIVVLFIIVTLMDMMLPRGNMKRYINFIVGLLIIFVVINPFLRLSEINMDMDHNNENFQENMLSSDELSAIQANQAKKIYEVSIKEDIKNYIESNSEYEVSEVTLITNVEEEKILIENLGVILRSEENKKESKPKIKIDKIKVDEKEQQIVQVTNENGKRFANLSNMLSQYIQIHEDKIQITIEDEGDQYGKAN